MKKLMILAAVVVATATSFGAKYNWSHKSGQYLYDGAATPAKLATGVETYLFVATASQLSEGYKAYSQQQLLTDLASGKTVAEITANSISSSEIGTTAGRMTTVNNIVYDGVATDSKLYVYTAIFDGNSVYISSEANAVAQASSNGSLSLADTTSSSKTMYNSSTYSAAGWYTVPEPTSGLLLLLGMAGLALRRRRA